MKKLLYVIAALIICAVIQLFSSCKKEELTVPSGTYSGKLTAVTTQGKAVYDLQVNFNDNNFTVTGSLENSGSVKSTNKDQITFVNTTAIPDHVDPNLILNGDYSLESKGDSITLTKNFEVNILIYPNITYQYKLKRIN